MHMASASPRGRTPGQPGEYVGNTSGWISQSLPLCGGKFARFFQVQDIFKFEIFSRGGGIRNFVKSWTVTTGIYRFTQTIESN